MMRLMFIRHADPDYFRDSLTPEGQQEAELLAKRISQLDVKDFYVSPLGRAKATAAYTLHKMNRTAIEKDWLQEFHSPIDRPYPSEKVDYCWDWLPAEWMKIPAFMDFDKWLDVPCMQKGNIREGYLHVCHDFDDVLQQHGYERYGNLYRVHHANHDRLVFFCHYGVTIVFVSWLLHISPMPLWQGMMSAPTGVTEFVSEEREKGIASFRMLTYGDISHLFGRREPSFAGRFCECYEDKTRH